ncbi:pre-mRNA-processing factor 39 [Musca vetustissima]|uniref:pre-mRNA-processing factor 39 n=1 Tax=Musca vetustissima TaxID=27455 RepID=UPI002AB6C0CF|nr:pre-mRNA-processing factor 39 [Musca vetustissima]
MASAEEGNVLQENENSGRRTRSGRLASATTTAAAAHTQSPARATRRTRKSQREQEELTELHEEERVEDPQQQQTEEQQQSNFIAEMMAEAAQGVGILDSEQSQSQLQQQQQVTAANVEEETNYVSGEENAIIMSDVNLDEKSSSFPFGPEGGQSETSEDLADNQENDKANTDDNQQNAQENSLLASLAGDNANSLPSVGGGDSEKENFEAKVLNHNDVLDNCEKMDSEDSLSEPAIVSDIPMSGGDISDATIQNTEIISEDELPLPTKPEINDAEEVSDEELPAPQRAELPPDAEVISEDELPAAAADKRSPSPSESLAKKRKAQEGSGEKEETDTATINKDEQYNPMSPTSESNDSPGPTEKKAKIEESKDKDKHREKERDKDKDRSSSSSSSKDKEKDKERETDKEKERKKLPDLDKYWRAVKTDPADFTGWTYLLQYVDNESDAEAAREAYDAFLSHYPYCYGYWRKYADYEKRKGIKANCNAVFERGLEAIPLSVDLWIHYLSHVKSTHADDEAYIRSQFERAIQACGLEFRSDKLWDAYLKWENEAKRYKHMVGIYDRLLAIPTQGYSGHFDNFQDLIIQHSLTSTIKPEEIVKIRTELREASSKSSSKSKSRRGSSKDKDHESASRDKDTKDEPSTTKDTENSSVEPMAVDAATSSGDTVTEEKKSSEDLSDLSTLTEEEISSIKDKVISIRRKLHKSTVAAVTSRWTFEEGIKRPYFHVKPLERCQLKNWKEYLDFEIEKGDRKRILVLFERCLIACALYDEFWLKMIRYLETILHEPGIPAILSDVFRRACEIHHPDKPSLHLMWSAFEECQSNFDKAAEILVNLESRVPNLLQVAYRRINIERRRGDNEKCKTLYEHYIATAKNKNIAGSLAIKYARFLNKICHDLEAGLKVLRQALEKDNANTRVALQMIDLALQRPVVDEDEVVLIMDKFMARENIEPEQKVLFAQRKVEFLEDFGSTAKGLQEAQRALQLALNKANEAKKKRESSPSRKSAGHKDASAASSSAQSGYNNGSSGASGNYYGSNSSAAYYGQQNSGSYPQQQSSYDSYYNHWQYNTGYSGYGQWSGYTNYY